MIRQEEEQVDEWTPLHPDTAADLKRRFESGGMSRAEYDAAVDTLPAAKQEHDRVQPGQINPPPHK